MLKRDWKNITKDNKLSNDFLYGARKVSRNDIKKFFKYIINGGNGGMMYILSYISRKYYSIGMYGVCCDYYEVESINGETAIISIGNNPVENKNTIATKNLKDIYESHAKRILNSRYSHKQKETRIKNLLKKFVSVCIEEQKNDLKLIA